MWKTVYACVPGVSHHRQGAHCQDECAVAIRDDTLIVACADGAGSAEHGRRGAQIACARFNALAKSCVETDPTLAGLDRGRLLGWLSEMRREIENLAHELKTELRDLACTFLGAIVTPEKAVFCQIGDGAIVAAENGSLRTVFWPQSGEFANTTFFLTDEQFDQHVQLDEWQCDVDELAVFTDGLERLILRFAEKAVHSPFLAPMFEQLRETEDGVDLSEPLRRFLDSDAVNARTDDDKTLVMATRRQLDGAQDEVR